MVMENKPGNDNNKDFRAPKPGNSEVHLPSLTPAEQAIKMNLSAILNAFDLSSAEEQQRLLSELKDTGDITLDRDTKNRVNAAAVISEYEGTSREDGLRKLNTLEEAGQQIPGIKVLLFDLSQNMPPLPGQTPESTEKDPETPKETK